MLSRALQPIRIGPLLAPNRVLMAAMDLAMDEEGGIADRHVAFLARRASTGLAWITTGGAAVRADGLTSPQHVRLDHDRHTDGFRRLADAVHAEGGRLVVQLTHAGRQTLAATIETDPIAPSPVPCSMMKQRPRVLGNEEMPDLVSAFAAAARRAADAGADGIELHMGHGYLLNTFLSPASNLREEGYGGDTERRCRLPGEVIAAVRLAVGDDLPVIARISADEMVDGGIDPPEAARIAVELEHWGAHAIHVSACTYGSMMWNIPIYLLPDASFRFLAARVKRAVSVPVIAVGRLHTPELIEDVIRSGDADMVAVGRPLIADPDFWVHLREGSAPRPCLKCNRCIHSIAYGPVSCSVNPLAALGDRPLPQPERYLSVLVVGGGPAGMMTAILASQLGHQVRLLEQRSDLGGQLSVAAVGPHKAPIAALKLHLAEQLRMAPVDVRTGAVLDRAQIEDFEPDRIVLAIGSVPMEPQVEGEAAFPIRTLDEALREPVSAGDTVAVLGGGPGGLEAAHALAAQGARVVVLEKRPRIGVGMVPHARYHAQRLLEEMGVRVLTRVKGIRADGHALYVAQRKTDHILDHVSQLVGATGRESKGIEPAITSGFRAPVITVGDALRPGSILEALESARRAVEQLADPPR